MENAQHDIREEMTMATKPEDAAYLAGILDTQARIEIRTKLVLTNPGRPYQLGIRIRLYGMPANVISFIQEASGHPGFCTSRSDGTHYWTFEGKGARAVVSLAMPYMRIQQQRAGILLRFGETLSGVGLSIKDPEWHERLICFEEMTDLDESRAELAEEILMWGRRENFSDRA